LKARAGGLSWLSWTACAAAAMAAIAWALLMGLAVLLGGGSPGAAGTAGPRASVVGIPPRYLQLYQEAASRYGLDWSVLAAIGKVECDHGRDPDPSCRRAGSVNGAGAGGPMQFLASTWRVYAVDGDGDGKASRWDAADAIFAAARYLRASGAPRDYRRAIFAYNHASWYVAEVERYAIAYREQAGPQPVPSGGLSGSVQAETSTPIELVEGARASLAPGEGHVALIPRDIPAAVQAMLIAGNELQDLPYGPAGHPDPLGAAEEDCSSTVNFILYRAGLRPLAELLRENPLAQDYVGWGAPGRGRWVTIYATASPTPHVFMVLAGLRIDTSHDGTDVGPNRYEDGPRWRILDRIPTWAHWSVRHPPGL
jgi:hypothetical protein